ncbi:hypothetical protein C1J05_20010 [Sulfitobacter sp. JL08]|uniref:hypothetical protein n=1 Tax=Sulfitobacter sp. JL08 TaxID=2070369 RepID=UPI000E0C10C7|nr:hypothetical protein [Sulfitobacter sp. JL08]AXI56484.1 hypothetical protein C1J05_20010 [Sulfitobacter sp. JL08]
MSIDRRLRNLEGTPGSALSPAAMALVNELEPLIDAALASDDKEYNDQDAPVLNAARAFARDDTRMGIFYLVKCKLPQVNETQIKSQIFGLLPNGYPI